MMKQTILFFVIACLYWGCAVKRKDQTIEQDIRLAQWNSRDSLWWERQLERDERHVINVQQYKLSKPDSCGIQYIEYLTQAEISNHTGTKEVTHAKTETVISAQEQHKQHKEKRIENKTSSAGWRYRLIGIIVSLGLLLFLHKRRNK